MAVLLCSSQTAHPCELEPQSKTQVNIGRAALGSCACAYNRFINSLCSGTLPKHTHTWLKRIISPIHQSSNQLLNHLINDVFANDASSKWENMSARGCN